MTTTHRPDALDLTKDNKVPYFMWDYRYTIRQIRETLSSSDERQRLRMMAKILRDARYEDVWKFISVKDLLREREELMRRLGRQRDFWEFMYKRWVKQGIVSDVEHPHTTSTKIP